MLVMTKIYLLILQLCFTLYCVEAQDDTNNNHTVFVVLLARNKEHVLPHFLHLFQSLSYPKDKITLYIRSDHNVDQTISVLENWLMEHEDEYASVKVHFEKEVEFYIEEIEGDEPWGYERNMKLIIMKEKALEEARSSNMDFILFLDMDAFLLDPDVIQKLIKEEKTIVAPMLTSTNAYSTFWGAMTETYWYKRSNDYIDIISYNKIGCFPVALLNGCVLVNLKHKKSNKLSFFKENMPGKNIEDIPITDIVIFSVSAQKNGIDMYVCNRVKYGHILTPSNQIKPIDPEIEQIKELKVNKITKEFNFNRIISVKKQIGLNSALYKKKHSFDKVYCINQRVNTERKNKMTNNFNLLGLKATFIEAFDWRDLNASFISSLGIKEHNDYKGTDLTFSVVANFLSHFFLWKEVVENKLNHVLVFEDDVMFDESFKGHLDQVIKDFKRLDVEWEFVYLGRDALRPLSETKFYGSDLILKPGYSKGTFAYMLSYRGACRLINTSPLNKILPLSEYISIMFDEHPTENWKKHYFPRVLNAFAIDPPIVDRTRSHDEDDQETNDTVLLSQFLSLLEGKRAISQGEQLEQVKTEL